MGVGNGMPHIFVQRYLKFLKTKTFIQQKYCTKKMKFQCITFFKPKYSNLQSATSELHFWPPTAITF